MEDRQPAPAPGLQGAADQGQRHEERGVLQRRRGLERRDRLDRARGLHQQLDDDAQQGRRDAEGRRRVRRGGDRRAPCQKPAAELDQADPGDKPTAPTFSPGPRSHADEVKQSNYDTSVTNWWRDYNANETAATTAITHLQDNHTEQAKVFQSIHGEPTGEAGRRRGRQQPGQHRRPPGGHPRADHGRARSRTDNDPDRHRQRPNDPDDGGDDDTGGGHHRPRRRQHRPGRRDRPRPRPGHGRPGGTDHHVPAGSAVDRPDDAPGGAGAVGGVGAVAGGAMGGVAAAGLAGGLAGSLNGGLNGAGAGRRRVAGSRPAASAASAPPPRHRGGLRAGSRRRHRWPRGCRRHGLTQRRPRRRPWCGRTRQPRIGRRTWCRCRRRGAAGRGGKDKKRNGEDRDLFDDGQDWLDDEAQPGLIDSTSATPSRPASARRTSRPGRPRRW